MFLHTAVGKTIVTVHRVQHELLVAILALLIVILVLQIRHGVFVVVVLLLTVGMMVFLAKKAIGSQGEFVPRHQLLVAGHASKALQVENLVLGSHDEVAGPEGAGALLALGAEEPVKDVCFYA